MTRGRPADPRTDPLYEIKFIFAPNTNVTGWPQLVTLYRVHAKSAQAASLILMNTFPDYVKLTPLQIGERGMRKRAPLFFVA